MYNIFSDNNLFELKAYIPDPKDTLKVPRGKMPQIERKDYPEFFKHLSKHGIKLKKMKIDPNALKPIQKDYSETGLEKQLEKISKGIPLKDVIVSSDNYVVDGHHRWLGAKNALIKVNALKANVPLKKLWQAVLSFPKVSFKDIY